MTLPKIKRFEEFDNFIDEAVAAAKERNADAERKFADGVCVQAFEGPFADQLLAAYQRRMPSEKLREQHYQAFRGFHTFAKNGGASLMPAHGAVIGCYLLHLATIEHKSPPELRAAADGIVFVHEQRGHHVDPAFIEAALDVAAEIAGGGDGGGEGVTPADPPPPTSHEALPLAAAGA